jgi:hypothetical protein
MAAIYQFQISGISAKDIPFSSSLTIDVSIHRLVTSVKLMNNIEL